MSKDAVGDWSETAANNTDVGGISIAEGMTPADLNNAIRECMAQIAAFYADAYTRDNLLGTVSQSGGVPTGAVIGSTTVGEGRCVRFADGTQICTLTTENLGPTATAIGNIWGTAADIDLGNWALPFIAVPVVSFATNSVFAWVGGTSGTSASAIGSVRILRATTSASTTLSVRTTGVGRWFA